MADGLVSETEILASDARKLGSREVPSLRASIYAALAVTALWLAIRLAFVAYLPKPVPTIHDEFSYLLGADTFAHGRLANPEHPLGRFFESPHVLIRPTYASKYPPGQALVLALGQSLFGSPFWGIIIGGAAMIFAFTLMLCTWVSFRWAIATSLATAIYMQPPMYWVDSYWGGCLAACGAALLLFSIGRHWRQRSIGAGATAALGLVALFWTRPYEGGVISLAALVSYSFVLWKQRRNGAAVNTPRVILWASPILLVALIFTALEDRAVTGKYTRLPYLEHDRQYSVAPVLWFLPLRPEPHYSDARLAAHHGSSGWEVRQWRMARGGVSDQRTRLVAFLKALRIALGPAAALLLLVPFALRDRRMRYLLPIAACGVLALLLEVFSYAHYGAPLFAVVTLIGAVAAECAAEVRIRGRRVGLMLASGLLAASALGLFAYGVYKIPATKQTEFAQFASIRDNVLKQLSGSRKPQLVIVRYPFPSWDIYGEIVYNGADIDAQHVVFAHDRGPEEDRVLLNYYRSREPWLLLPADEGRYQLLPYRD